MRRLIPVPVIAAAAFSAALSLSAQQPVKAPGKPSTGKSAESATDFAKIDISASAAKNTLDDIKAKLAKETFEKDFPPKIDEKAPSLKAIQLESMALGLENISKSLDLEEDTEISRKWFVALAKELDGLSIPKRKMESAVENRKKDLYLKALEQYEAQMKSCKEHLEKPLKLSKDELRRIKEENAKRRIRARNEAAAEARKRKTEKDDN